MVRRKLLGAAFVWKGPKVNISNSEKLRLGD